MKTLLTLCAVIAMATTAFPQGADVKSHAVYEYAGVPSNGTSEIDTLTIQSGTASGTFTITIAGGRTTAPITWSATNATLVANVDAALEAMTQIGTGGVTTAVGSMTAGIGTITITFTGKNAKRDMPALSVGTDTLSASTPTPNPSDATITTTTPGVEATFRDAKTGQLLVDTVTPDLYLNDSTTPGSPTWTKVSP